MGARAMGRALCAGADLASGGSIIECGRSADTREGVTAFAGKRAANFPARVSVELPAFFPWWPERPFTPRP